MNIEELFQNKQDITPVVVLAVEPELELLGGSDGAKPKKTPALTF